MNQNYTYQIIFFLPQEENDSPILRELSKIALKQNFRNDSSFSAPFTLLFDDEDWVEYKSNSPTIAFFLGGSKRISDSTSTRIRSLLNDNVMFIPCVSTYTNFNKEVPHLLQLFQAMEYADMERFLARAKNAALGYFHLLNKPKVFISYTQREESTRQFAITLYEELHRHHYTLFLDTHSIMAPSIFQQKLEEELWDGDVIVVLDSQESQKSEWCQREIDLATEASIGIIRVGWPGITNRRDCELLENIDLEQSVLNSETQQQITIEAIIDKIAHIRARAHEARLKKLLDKISVHEGEELTPVHVKEGYCFSSSSNPKQKQYIPVIGIPRSQDFERAQKNVKRKIDYELSYISLPHQTEESTSTKLEDDIKIHDKTNSEEHIQWLSQKLNISIKSY